MSNPTVTIGDTIDVPVDPEQTWEGFTKISWEEQLMFTYGTYEYYAPLGSQEAPGDSSKFYPQSLGEEYIIFAQMINALNDEPPSFSSQAAWDGLKRSPAGFVNPVTHSMFPTLVIPSKILVDNGFLSSGNKMKATYKDSSVKNLFNWVIDTWNGTSVGDSTTEIFKYGQIGGQLGSQYVSVKAKVDSTPTDQIILKLENPTTPPLGSDYDWLKSDSTDLVVGGAFCLMVNVVPHRPAGAEPRAVADAPWSIVFTFADTDLKLGEEGLKIRTSGDLSGYYGTQGPSGNWEPIDLAEAKSKQSPPQRQKITDKEPILILVYPVWGGFIVTNGTQENPDTIKATSYLVKKLKKATIYDPEYSTPFDPTAPAEVEVGVGTGDNNVEVDFGSDMMVTADGCRFELAYLPVFFSRECWFDHWFVGNTDNGTDDTYTYETYPIWTKNGTASALSPSPPAPEVTGVQGPQEGTEYVRTRWRLGQDKFNRHSGELFGAYMRTEQTHAFPVLNGNGSFDLTWTGGSAAGPVDPWEKYIQSVSVTVGLDGSNGTLTVDKYGVAGQDAVAVQSIGAITVDATGANDTDSGSIFQGLAFGISDQQSSDGASWTVKMEGLEKKLDDIMLINVPFVDGFLSGWVMTFLSKYAGIIDDQTNADPTIPLTGAVDLNAPIFNWQTGTSIRTALDQLMDNINHNYVVRDGKIFFYELDIATGLPLATTTDWEPYYPNTKMVTIDQAPDFEDLRNNIVGVALKPVPAGHAGQLKKLPVFPRIVTVNNVTVPDIPWERALVEAFEGAPPTDAEMTTLVERVAAKSSVFITIGSTTIPGNADIKPYDRWGDLWITSVSHNMDMQNKSWTTSLEFANA